MPTITDRPRKRLSQKQLRNQCRASRRQQARKARAARRQIDRIHDQLPKQVRAVFDPVEPAFTHPTHHRRVFLALAAILTLRGRTITNLLRCLGSLAPGHPSSYHRIFSRDRWSSWTLARCFAQKVLARFVPDGPIELAGDDTVEEHPGKNVYGKGCHRDPVRSTHSFTAYRWGHKWVALTVLVRVPFATRRWALPLLMALYLPEEENRRQGRRHKTPSELMQQMLAVLIHWFPDRQFIFTGDGGYGTHALASFAHRHRRHLSLVSLFYPNANLCDPPPVVLGKRPSHRPRKKGAKLPAPQAVVAATAQRKKLNVSWYGGGRRNVEVVSGTGQWYKSGAALIPILWVFVRDLTGTHRDTYLFTTDLSMTVPRIIETYTGRWNIDTDFNLCKPGWNSSSDILVHAPEVIPSSQAPAYTTDARAIDRLPPSLQALLREFSWRDDADVVNAVAVLLTGLLINHFVDDPHPAVIVDANQSGTGKTLLVQTFGRVLDDAEPPRISLVCDEELEKKLCAQLRSSRTSIFFLDNVRATIESMVLEANLLSPLLSFRILGRSATMERPNTYLWMVTSNMTSGTTDFIRRGVAIRQFFEGDPKSRKFSGNPLAYAARHRLEILGELAGMIVRWVEQGKPLGQQQHRCERWAEKIGGILDANGLGEFFLANASEAEMAMDQGLVDLATLAERVMGKGLGQLYVPADGVAEAKGLPPGLWVPVFLDTQILRDKLTESNNKGKATAVGIFLSGKRDRTVAIETSDGPRLATLRRRDASAGQKHYYFEIAIPEAAHSQEACGSIKASTEVLPTSSVDGPNQKLLSSGNGAGQTAQDSPPPSWTNANPTSGDGLPAAGEVEWV